MSTKIRCPTSFLGKCKQYLQLLIHETWQGGYNQNTHSNEVGRNVKKQEPKTSITKGYNYPQSWQAAPLNIKWNKPAIAFSDKAQEKLKQVLPENRYRNSSYISYVTKSRNNFNAHDEWMGNECGVSTNNKCCLAIAKSGMQHGWMLETLCYITKVPRRNSIYIKCSEQATPLRQNGSVMAQKEGEEYERQL